MRLRPFLRRFRNDVAGWGRFGGLAAVAAIVAVAAVWIGLAYVAPAIAAHPYFTLRSVRVACDTDAAPPAVLASRAGLYDGTSVWTVDSAGAEAALEAAPWVRDARVERHFPDRVHVRVSRRQPVAATLVADGPFLIDSEGMIYREEGLRAYPDVPYVTGWDTSEERGERIVRLHRAMGFTAAAERVGVAISQVHVDDDGVQWAYPESHRMAVRLGARFDAELVANRLQAVLATLPRKFIDVHEIDLTYPDRAVLRTTEGRAAHTIAALATQRAGERDLQDDRLSSAAGGPGSNDRG